MRTGIPMWTCEELESGRRNRLLRKRRRQQRETD
jgi:hypothetical protein